MCLIRRIFFRKNYCQHLFSIIERSNFKLFVNHFITSPPGKSKVFSVNKISDAFKVLLILILKGIFSLKHESHRLFIIKNSVSL